MHVSSISVLGYHSRASTLKHQRQIVLLRLGRYLGLGSLCNARVDTKTAPTPIGPKWPVKSAFFQSLISGIRLYNINDAGIRLKNSIAVQRATNRGSVIPSSGTDRGICRLGFYLYMYVLLPWSYHFLSSRFRRWSVHTIPQPRLDLL